MPSLEHLGVATYRLEYELKKVSLRESCEGWPAGTVGVIIEPFPDAALVEISGEYGVTLAEISVPYDGLDVLDDQGAPPSPEPTPNQLVDRPSAVRQPGQPA